MALPNTYLSTVDFDWHASHDTATSVPICCRVTLALGEGGA
jgi:hypothetical protein